MKNGRQIERPHVRSGTHGFTVVPNPYEDKWSHIPVKETTQRLINISKQNRKRNKPKLCFTTSTRSIPMRATHKPNTNRPSSAPVTQSDCLFQPKAPTPPAGGGKDYSTRKIRSAVPRVNAIDNKPSEVRTVSPTFELTRTPTSVEMKVTEDLETKAKLKVVEADKAALEEEIEKLKKQVAELEERLLLEARTNKDKQKQLQHDFNKSLAATLDEKKKDLRRIKEIHYAEISTIKHKMNEALRLHRNESSLAIAKLKGEIDSNRENYRNKLDKMSTLHAEELQDLQNELTLTHQREKTRLLRDLEDKLLKEKDEAIDTLKKKLDSDISLLKQQHAQEVEGILHQFEGISLEEVETNRSTIQEQQIQLSNYRRAHEKQELEMRSLMSELAAHKSALKQLQDSFFDKVHQVDKKYNQQLSSLLIDNKDLRKRYLKKCDELFTLKSAFNRLQEAKGYIAKEMLSALMQGKQPHVITSSAVKASWTKDGTAEQTPDQRAVSACSVEDPAALMLSTCSYIQDNSNCSRNPRPLSERLFSQADFLYPLSPASSEGNLAGTPDSRLSAVRPTPPQLRPDPQPSPPTIRKQRPVSSVCIVRPHSRASEDGKQPIRSFSVDSRPRSAVVQPSPKFLDPSDFNLPALPSSPELSRRRSHDEEVSAAAAGMNRPGTEEEEEEEEEGLHNSSHEDSPAVCGGSLPDYSQYY